MSSISCYCQTEVSRSNRLRHRAPREVRASMWYHPATKEKYFAETEAEHQRRPPFSFSGNYSIPVETDEELSERHMDSVIARVWPHIRAVNDTEAP